MLKYCILGAFLFLLAIQAQGQQYDGCPGTPNNQPLIEGNFTLVSSVKNGKKYAAPYDGRLFYILNLNGSAYEMGYAYGQLMKDEIPQMIEVFDEFVRWIILNNVSSIIPKLPKAYRTWIQDTAITIAQGLLSLNWYIVQPYTNKRWNQEMQGMADASGVNIWFIRQLNMVPELLKAACSILGSYGKSSSTKKLLHLRSLDWEQHAKMSKWPTITVYHSTEEGSIPFANVGWPVLIGSLTGYNSAKVGVGERLGGSAPVNQTRFGTPWMFVLRDALQFSKSQPEYIQYLTDAHRTCAIYLGVGGENYFNIVKYAYGYLEAYNWTNWGTSTREDALWKSYHNEPCFQSIISANYGNITSETIYRYIAPMAQTGDSQVAVMDYSNDTMVVMYPNPITFNPGYNAPPIHIDLKPYFNPTSLE